MTRLRKFCGLLSGHSWRQAERVAQAAREAVAPWLPEDAGELTLLDFLLYLAEALEHNREHLTAADNLHNHELQTDRNLRQERDAATAVVREKMLQLRDSLDGLYGPGGAAKIFEDPVPIPTDPMALAQFTGHALDNLRDEDFPMPTPLQQGFKLDREQAVLEIEGPHRRLVAALSQLESSGSESKFSQSHKDGSVSETEVFAFKVARYYEAFFALVGLDALAGRVRRSSHRTSSGGDPEAPEDAGGEDEGEAPELVAEPAAPAAAPTAVDGAAG